MITADVKSYVMDVTYEDTIVIDEKTVSVKAKLTIEKDGEGYLNTEIKSCNITVDGEEISTESDLYFTVTEILLELELEIDVGANTENIGNILDLAKEADMDYDLEYYVENAFSTL